MIISRDAKKRRSCGNGARLDNSFNEFGTHRAWLLPCDENQRAPSLLFVFCVDNATGFLLSLLYLDIYIYMEFNFYITILNSR